jgi:hypothetical protein
MKTILILLLSTVCVNSVDFSKTNLAQGDLDKIVAAIYKLEGGVKTKYPYGIKSIQTNGDVAKAKRICENTVRNNFTRWNKSGRTNEFFDFLGNVYCPKSADLQGNINWRRNIRELTK